MVVRSRLFRILACSGLILLPVLLWLSFIQPMIEWRQNISKELLAEQDKAARLLASIQSLELQKEAAEADLDIDGSWQAADPSQATALVQAAITRRARAAGISFRSIAPIRSPDLPHLSTVAFRIEAELTLDLFVDLLKAIEFDAPLLMIERASVRRLARRNSDALQPSVFVQFDLVAPVMLPGDGL